MLRCFLLALVHKMVLLPQLVVQVHKALIIDPKIKLVPILKKAQLMLPNSQLIAEQVPETFLLVNNAAISQNSFLASHH